MVEKEKDRERLDRQKALELTIGQIEKQFGKGSIMRLGQETKVDVPAISTGSLALDIALGIGGLPHGRVVEIFGPESSGKTTLALSTIVEAQRAGGVAAFIDAEHALDPTYAKTVGVNLDDLLISQPDTGEQALEITEMLVRSNAVALVVIDSVAALVPRAEIEGEMGDQFMGLQARLMSQAMRKLTAAIETHQRASEKLHRVKDRAFDAIRQRIGFGTPTTEYDVQQLMGGWFREEGLVSDSDPIVAAAANAGNPHYLPGATMSRAIAAEELVLLDLWGKLDRPGAVFADITWMGYTGRRVPERYAEAFAAVSGARDAAVRLVGQAAREGRELRGWEVDRAASAVLGEAGYGDRIMHRTGHSLGESVHGNGVNMDDYETHDDRRLLPGTGFTIEPGVYFDDFGVRSEINMIVHAHDAAVTGPLQTEILALL